MKLGLGTAQFGLDYGISNQDGITPEEEVNKILDVAVRRGIDIIDTAPLYGSSENVLGKWLDRPHQFSIVTKTPKFLKTRIRAEDGSFLEKTFHQSLLKMGLKTAYGLLIHHADDLIAEDSHLLIERMQELKSKGLVRKVGVSVYTREQIDFVLERFSIDLVQIPINVFDQRLLTGGRLKQIKEEGIEIHARSIFLQGLLLLPDDELPSYFNSIRNHVTEYQKCIRKQGLSLIQAALGFVAGIEEIDAVLCGVNNHAQLLEVSSYSSPISIDKFSRFAITDENILNPSLWKAQPNGGGS